MVEGSGHIVRLDKNNLQQDRIVLTVSGSYIGFANNDTFGARSTVLIPCNENDTIRIYLQSGSIRTFGFTNSPRNSFGGFLIG